MKQNRPVFGEGFLNPEPSFYGAQILAKGKHLESAAKTAKIMKFAFTAVGIATILGGSYGIGSATSYIPSVKSISASAEIVFPLSTADRQIGSWNLYLEALKASGSSRDEQVSFVRDFFLQIRETIDDKFPLPHAGPTPDGAFQLVWDRGSHHIDIDIYQDGTFEWFYSNRLTNAFYGDEGCKIGSLPSELVQYLRYIINRTSAKNELVSL